MIYKYNDFNIAILPDNELPYKRITRDEIITVDSFGIPLRQYAGGLYYHPVFLIDHAIYQLNKNIEFSVKIADKLIKLGNRINGDLWFPYPFDFRLHGRDELMKAEWYSAMAQGMALSLFSRLSKFDNKYLKEAFDIFETLRYIENETWCTTVDNAGYLWFEEYPINPPAHTLNGMIFAIYGIYDYFLITGKDRDNLLKASLTTIKENILRFRVDDGMSLYCLKHKVVDAYYHSVHIEQLKMLSKISGDYYFDSISELFKKDYK